MMQPSYIMTNIIEAAKIKQQEHFINVFAMLKNPTAIPEHTSLVDAVRQELRLASEQRDIIEAVMDFKDKHIEDGIY